METEATRLPRAARPPRLVRPPRAVRVPRAVRPAHRTARSGCNQQQEGLKGR